jgi:hypothetical protein
VVKEFFFFKDGEFPPPASLPLYDTPPSFTFMFIEKLKIL